MASSVFHTSRELSESVDFVKGSALRKGGLAMLQGHPCKILDIKSSAPGKHGHRKVRVVGKDVFTQKRTDDLFASHDMVPIPVIEQTEVQLLNITDDGFLSLLLENNEIVGHLKLPDSEVGNDIRSRFDSGDTVAITVAKFADTEGVLSVKSLADEHN